MSQPTLRERLAVFRLTAAQRRRHSASRTLRSSILRWRLAPARADELLFIPPDLRTADPSFADELAGGQIGLAGIVADLAGQSPFRTAVEAPAWLAQLHGFGWLRHLRAAGTPAAQSGARALVADWIALQKTRAPGAAANAWRPDVAASRVIALINNAGFLLDGADQAFYRSFLRNLGVQVHNLDVLQRTALPGVARLQCRIALVMAELAIAGHDRHLPRAERLLLAEIDRQILPDGGHVSRNPDVVVDLLLDLLPLRQCYPARRREAPPALSEATRRMAQFLRTLRLGHGGLARFNGAGHTPADAIATVLAVDAGQPVAAHVPSPSGYARLAQGETVIILECGRAPSLILARAAHAGCLAFEMSSGAEAVIVNGGAEFNRYSATAAAARATASHSTLCLGSTSSARMVRFAALEALIGDAALAGPSTVTVSLTESGEATTVAAAHDGYLARFALLHARQLTLARDGRQLAGTDTLQPPTGVLRTARDLPFAIHFHLAPTTIVTVDAGGTSAQLLLANGEGWQMSVAGARASVEVSIDYAHILGPRGTSQIVLRGACPGDARVTWVLARISDASPADAKVV